MEHGGHVGAQFLRQFGQDADNLTAFLGLQLADAVVGFHHFGWLDKNGLARGTLVVDDAA